MLIENVNGDLASTDRLGFSYMAGNPETNLFSFILSLSDCDTQCNAVLFIFFFFSFLFSYKVYMVKFICASTCCTFCI